MAKILEVKRHDCAGIDLGSDQVFVGFPDQSVSSFSTHTVGFEQLIAALKSAKVSSVAMESTGVYGSVLFDMLREASFEVYLVNPKYTKSRSGKKSDPHDSSWIQQLHSVDLLAPSYVPEKPQLELRHYVRTREGLIADKSRQVNKMQKSLIMMNIRLDTVLSQVHGVSGIRVIEAMIAGERDPEKLLELCDARIKKNKASEMLYALQGHYQDQHIFTLRQALTTYRFIETQIQECDTHIEQVYESLCEALPESQEPLPKPKPIRHNKPKISKLQHYNWVLAEQRDLTVIPGFTDYTLMQLFAEVGFDLDAFPSEKHFTSWLGLAPQNQQSGKRSWNRTQRSNTRAGQIFRLRAQSVINSKHVAIGTWARKIRARKGPAIAIKALARKLAEIFYRAVTKGLEYVEKGTQAYTEKMKQLEVNKLKKMAKKLGFSVTQNNLETELS